jgi:hypothetical protein
VAIQFSDRADAVYPDALPSPAREAPPAFKGPGQRIQGRRGATSHGGSPRPTPETRHKVAAPKYHRREDSAEPLPTCRCDRLRRMLVGVIKTRGTLGHLYLQRSTGRTRSNANRLHCSCAARLNPGHAAASSPHRSRTKGRRLPAERATSNRSPTEQRSSKPGPPNVVALLQSPSINRAGFAPTVSAPRGPPV